jgi:hypothetical protein
MGWERKVPNETKLAALMKAGKSISDIAKAYHVRPQAVRLHAIRYGLVECRTNAVRLAELQSRPAPSDAPKRGIAVHDDRITFTRDAHVAGRGWELRALSLPCPLIYQNAVQERLSTRGGSHA